MATITSGAADTPSRQDVRTQAIRASTPWAAALRRATASAAAETSVAMMRASRQLGGQRDRHAAGPGADVGEQARAARAARQTQRLLDQQLGLGTRREHAGPHLELQAPELAPADDGGHRLAARAPVEGSVVGRPEALRRRVPPVAQVRRPVPAQDVACEHLGVERRDVRRQARGDQPRRGGPDPLDDGHDAATSALSCSAW